MRTLLAEPRALLLDEPFGKLDRPLRARFRRFVFEHARAAGLPTLLVTHDETDAAAADGAVVAFPEPPASAPPNVVPLPGTRRRPA
jgi:putative thiamine transport system ATP-binding protein